MSQSLNAVTAPDQYSPQSTLDNTPANRIVLDVSNQSIYWNLKIPVTGSGGNWDGTETYMLPGSRVILEPCVGFRFRAATPAAQIPAGGKQAVVTVRAVS